MSSKHDYYVQGHEDTKREIIKFLNAEWPNSSATSMSLSQVIEIINSCVMHESGATQVAEIPTPEWSVVITEETEEFLEIQMIQEKTNGRTD